MQLRELGKVKLRHLTTVLIGDSREVLHACMHSTNRPVLYLDRGFNPKVSSDVKVCVGDKSRSLQEMVMRITARFGVDGDGLLLVDTIDAGLHPQEQAEVLPLLRRLFPNMQIICSTFSPLVVSGCRPDQVFVVEGQEVRPLGLDPRLMTATEIYRRIFGVVETPPGPIFAKVKQYEFLCASPYRTDEQEEERKQLRRELRREGVKRIAEPVSRKPRPPMPE